MLEIRNVTVSFGDADPAIAEASLDVVSGQPLLICGATGSGKTTLLQTLAGLIPYLIRPHAFSGSITFGGHPLSEMTKNEVFSTISIVSQTVEDQLWDLSVEDLIAFPLENRGLAKPKIRERLQELLEDLRLESLCGRRVLTLSGGERRMVAIAAALAISPRLLVLDEPTTGLDPSARQRLVHILSDLRADAPSLVIAEQDPASVRDIISQVALIKGGRLSTPVAALPLMQQEEAWRTAGVLPPNLPLQRVRAHSTGDILLSTEGIRTQLTRTDGRTVLQGISLEIRAGEVVGLIGRNGAGKTTLFQSILGLTPIAAGSIAIGRERADGWTTARRARSVALLPQNMRRILFHMTVLEEVVFAITAGETATIREAAADWAMAVLRKYGLGDQANANPFALSSRQQALLGLVCAEAANAAVAILDEPLLARDLEGRRMLQLFLDYALEHGRAAMIISHDLELIQDVATRVLILDDGEIAFTGKTEASWETAAFRKLGWPIPRAWLKERRHAAP